MSTSVASVVSFFPDAENGFQTTLASTIASGAATVPLNSVASYTNGLPAVFVVDPTDPLKKQTFTGIIDTAGVQITSVVWTAGTNQTHTAGSTVVDYATATHIAMMSKGIGIEHKQAGTHSAITADSVTVATGKITTTAVGKLEDAAIPLSTYRTNMVFDYVISGGVWTADSVGANLNASMTAIVCMINGRRISIGAVTARAFTTNVDTYIDILDNADGTGTLVYTTAATNAASPALAANSIRIGIIQAAATITATTKVNQGEEDKVFPIASSIAYTVTDSLGNLICPRDPSRKILGYRQVTSSQTNTSATQTQITGLTCPVIVPTGRKVKITLYCGSANNNTSSAQGGYVFAIWDGVVTSGTQLNQSKSSYSAAAAGAQGTAAIVEAIATPATASKTYNGGFAMFSSGQAITSGSSTSPVFMRVELV